ncbi:DUF2975 domain-containing protein [Emticicia sp.]|uniref:DUF2975 domain-containing protein n=1 Tax=Emticicia sp. TaxID=1930953 RepID=UPI0037514D98
MKTQTKTILEIIKYLALIGAIGFSIECGSQIVSLIVNFFKPEIALKLYKASPKLYELRNFDLRYYGFAMTLVIWFSATKAYIWYYIFDFLNKLSLENPFTVAISTKIQKISFLLFELWVVSFIGNNYIDFVGKESGIDLANHFNHGEYFFMAGIVYIISQIFKRGVELQEENELTV